MSPEETCDLLAVDVAVAETLRRSLPERGELERRAERMKGLADPTRLALALSLAGAEELCVCDLAWIAGRSEKLVSHHLRQLRFAGLARSRREGRMIMYSLTEPGRSLVDVVAPPAGALES